MNRRMQLPRRRLSARPQVELLESRTLLSFGAPINTPVDANPLGVALADLNGDGKLDAVTANYGDGTVDVLLGNGDGTFQFSQSYFVGAKASTVVIGDFNGDHIPDLAVGHFSGSANTVTVLLGNGDGTFKDPVDYTVGSNPIWITTADLRGTGVMDIIASNNDSASISVLLGNGDGTFQPAQNYAVGDSPLGLAAVDINGDHIPDLLVANSGSNTLSVLLGNGDGTFPSPVDYAVGNSPSDVTVGDFNGDGAPDLAVVSMNSNDVTILLNDGQGGFTTNAVYSVGTTPIGAVAGDFNGDGKLDLVVGYYNFTNTKVTTLLGNGDGTFQTPVDYAADVGPVGVAVGDVNGDGAPDIVAADVSTSQVSVLLNLKDWAPPAPPGGHASFPYGDGSPYGQQEPVAQPAASAADSGRQTEVLFLLSRVKNGAREDGEPLQSVPAGAQGSEGVGLEGNFSAVDPLGQKGLHYDGMTGWFN